MKRLLFVPFLLFSLSSLEAFPDSETPTAKTVFEDVQNTFNDATKSLKNVIAEMKKYTTVAPIVQKLRLDSTKTSVLRKSLKETVHLEDLALILVIGWLSVPALRLPFEQLPFRARESMQDYYAYVHFFLAHIQQIARIAVLVYLVDIIKMICIVLGFEFCKMSAFPHAFAQAAYTLWVANRLLALKRYYLRRFVSQHPETYGRMQIVNRLLDAAVMAGLVLVLLSIIRIKMGVATTSFLAFGSVGTLTVSLATQGIAQNIVNGLMLASSDRIYEGDSVQFGSGRSGKIVKLGWLETVLLGSDDILVSLPNAELVKQPVSNLSRISFSQVKQILCFKYQDTEKLPLVMESIKQEIASTCPELIQDGSRPFRAHWTDYGPNCVQAVVDCHFRIKPVGDEYWDNRQRVLRAIDKAVKKHGLEFAFPDAG